MNAKIFNDCFVSIISFTCLKHPMKQVPVASENWGAKDEINCPESHNSQQPGFKARQCDSSPKFLRMLFLGTIILKDT